MKIRKRDGHLEQLSFDKIIYRLRKLCNDPSLQKLSSIDPDIVAQRVVSSIYDGVSSVELDEEAARIAIGMTDNPEYSKLSSRIIISNLHKSTHECFSEVMEQLYSNVDKNGDPAPILADDVIEVIRQNKNVLNFAIDYSRDYFFDYFGFKTLEKSYLMKIRDDESGKMVVVERPQHLYMRVAVGIHKNDIENAIKTYHLISQHFYTHASPTLFNSGTKLANMASCFLIGTDDSIGGIYKTITDCAFISKVGGGIGVHISNIRAKGSLIRGTNGESDGIIPMLKVYNTTSVFVNQCITPDTIVYSQDGFKRMDQVTTDDFLVTKDGTFKKVNEVIVNKKDETIYSISNTGSIDPLKCTKEHDIFVIKANKFNTPGRLIDMLNRGVKSPEFVPASELKERYYMGYPIPTFECDIENFTPEQCRIYGIMLGDGSVIHGQTGSRYQVTLNNTTKLDTKAFVIRFLTQNNIHYWITNDCEICFAYNNHSREKMGITEDMLYDVNKHKRMDPRFLHLPKHKASMVLKGMLESDGCNTSNGLWFISTDKNLIYSAKYLFLRFGILTSTHTVDKVGQVMSVNKNGKPIISRKICYYLRVPKLQILKDYNIKTDFDVQFCKSFFKWNDIIFTRICKIDKVHYSGPVYDFNMIDNHNYLTDMGLVHNSGKRKGSFAIYTEPWHADILEFLDLKKNQGHEDMRARDLFYAIWMPDLFMKTVEADGDWYLMCPDECPGLTDCFGADFEKLYNQYVEEKRYKRVVKAQEIWRKIMDSQIETGVPYIGYKDAVNKKCNQKNLGTIKSSNLCVAPETMILTSKGYFPIKELEGHVVQVWNGHEFTETTIQKTGENVDLLTVKLSNGTELHCTPYHKFYIATGKRPSEYPRLKQIEAKDLKKEMKLIKSNFPVIKEGSSDFPLPYEHGLFSAEGTYEHNEKNRTTTPQACGDKTEPGQLYCKRHRMYQNDPSQTHVTDSTTCLAPIGNGLPRITLYGEKKKLAPFISKRIEACEEDSNGRINCRLPPYIKAKYTVPINCNLDIKLRWFEGLVDGDGCIVKSDQLTGIQVGSINKDFLVNVLFLLQTLGCDPKINIVHEEGYKLLPNGQGGHDEYFCQTSYRMCVTSFDVAHLSTLGFNPKRLKISGVFPKNNTKRWIQVEEVEWSNRIADTYCFKEEKRGMGIFNGVLTGQCSEISLYSDNKSYAVCNLSSIALPKYVKQTPEGPVFDFDHLKEVAEHVVLALNCVIDETYYPTPETRQTNLAHRPLGIGIQGLADVYMMMKMPFESDAAKKLNKEIFETLYYGVLVGSLNEAKKHGKYESFEGSPFSKGLLQFDLAAEHDNIQLTDYISGRWDWNGLKEEMKKFGLRNSMTTALMPTASTAQIMGNSECFEPIDSCIFKRRVLSGEYLVINKHLVADLQKLGLWSKEMKDTIIAHNGSIADIPGIPSDLKEIYKNVWEISMKSVIEQARDRGVFVDQMQSMNLFMANPNYKKLTSMHFYAWKNGLKTGMYYLRSKASSSAGKFSVDPELEKKLRDKVAAGDALAKEEEKLLCSIDNKDECMMCSS